MKVLITGSAGFIGYHLTRRLMQDGEQVVGLDNINDYYDTKLKHQRLIQLGLPYPKFEQFNIPVSSLQENFRFVRMDLEDKEGLFRLFESERFDWVINLAAQAGVRYSLTHPDTYIKNNIQGFLNILESVRQYPVEHLVYASSSSVYGVEKIMPFVETGAADHPASLYAVSKRTNELMAHSYSHLYGIPTTGLRFFTVYGPWGRPDMALFLFAQAITQGKPIDVFNHGDMKRDFTYVDDIVEGIVRVSGLYPQGDRAWDGWQSGTSTAPARVYNIGNGNPISLMRMISILEEELGRSAEKNMLPLQAGDVPATWADCSILERDTGYRPSTTIGDGIREFVKWFKAYANNNKL